MPGSDALAVGSPTRHGGSARAVVERLLLGSVDFGLLVAIFAVPLLMGGRQPLGQFVLAAAAVWAAICWCLRQGLGRHAAWFRSPLDFLLVAAPAWIALELVAIPPSLLATLSPRVFQTLPLWDHGATSLGTWNTLSLAPAATRDVLVLTR